MKNWNLFALLISLFLISLIIGLVGLTFRDSNKTAEEERAFCGTRDYNYIPSTDNDTINIKIGKELFRGNCATCHNKNMKQDMTGPALKGAIRRFNNDTIKFTKYLIDQENYLITENDERILLMHDKFMKIKKPKYEELTINDAKSIIKYIEKIYQY